MLFSFKFLLFFITKILLFQNKSLSWDADHPKLSKCSELFLSTFLPCGFLWLFFFFAFKNAAKTVGIIQLNFMNGAKLLLTFLLMFSVACEMFLSDDEKTHFTVVLWMKLATFVS